MAQSDRLPSGQYSSILYDGWYVPPTATSGYTCGACGGWVASGTHHICGVQANTFGHQCPRCGQYIFGGGIGHVCNPPTTIGTFYPPVAAPPCHHCYCIDVPPSGERTKDHYKCCRCGDTRVKP